MVQILPEVPSFGKQFAQNLGTGLSKGLDFTSEIMREKHKQNQRQKLIKSIEGSGQSSPSFAERMSPEQLKQKFIEALPQIEEQLGRELTPKDIDQLWTQAQQMQSQPSAKPSKDLYEQATEYELAEEPGLAKIKLAQAKEQSRQRFQEKKEMEPKVEALQNKLDNLESEQMDFSRLNELFAPENDEKFPKSWAVGLLTKNGEINPNVLANLSEEAQEAVKLIANRVTGVKDTFGSQITGFEVRKFMERLPTLMNTAEGRRRVLRDLDIMNEINQLHTQGVLDIINRYGGAGEISMSKANDLFRKEYAPQLKQLKEEYVRPESAVLSELTPGTARRNRDREVIDPETGQKFRSDGQKWIPVVD